MEKKLNPLSGNEATVKAKKKEYLHRTTLMKMNAIIEDTRRGMTVSAIQKKYKVAAATVVRIRRLKNINTRGSNATSVADKPAPIIKAKLYRQLIEELMAQEGLPAPMVGELAEDAFKKIYEAMKYFKDRNAALEEKMKGYGTAEVWG